MCWLCEVDDNPKCDCCKYMASSPKPELVRSSFYKSLNGRCMLPDTRHLSKVWFFNKSCFIKTSAVVKKVDQPKVGVQIGMAMWNRTKKRMLDTAALQRMRQLSRLHEVPLGIQRLIRFQKVLDLLGTAPWANIRFHENEQILKMMTASHLRLIVGKEEWSEHKSLLYPIVDHTRDLSAVENIVWITNRQQGKTTNLARFNAALIMLSPVGGNVKYVYSTGLDRSQELCRDSKKYINWVQKDSSVQERLEELGMVVPRIVTNNERMFITECAVKPGIFNTLKARPMNADGCRGDNPHSADFDEVGFIDEKFWVLFAFPLLQVGGRVFNMATTPPKLNSFFDAFAQSIRKRNEENDYLFMFVNHSMVCAQCIERQVESECSHKLYLVPKWKGIAKFGAMRRLVSEKQRKAFDAEIFGTMDREVPTYFPKKLTDYTLLEKPRVKTPDFGKLPVVYISVDPASHDVSCMGMCAASYSKNGEFVVLGLAETSIFQCQTHQIQMCVANFTTTVLSHYILRRYKRKDVIVIPIVECNNNEPAARDIVMTIRHTIETSGYKYIMPFSKRFFASAISDDLGVWATNDNKVSGVQQLYFMMFENRLGFVKNMVTVPDIHKKAPKCPTITSVMELLRDELVQFHDEGRAITGKTTNTNDDVAMSLIQAAFWSQSIRATSSLESNILVTQ